MRRARLGFWTNKHNQKFFFERLKKKFNFQILDDWYKVSGSEIKRQGGGSLLSVYRDSLFRALSAVYPENSWKAWKFECNCVPDGFWNSKENQLKFMEDLANIHQINENNWEKWYTLKKLDVVQNGGGGLLSLYSNSTSKLVMTLYPEFQWEQFKFQAVPNGYWNNVKNQRKFFNSLAKKLGIGVNNWKEWYKVSHTTINEHGGAGLLHANTFTKENIHKIDFSDIEQSKVIVSSFSNDEEMNEIINKIDYRKLLMSVYPEYPWQLWKFERIPRYYLNDIETVKQMINYIEEELGILISSDWYSVSLSQLKHLGFYNLWKYYGGIIPLLKRVYPDVDWNIDAQRNQFMSKNLKIQRRLHRAIRLVFPNITDIYINYPHPSLAFIS